MVVNKRDAKHEEPRTRYASGRRYAYNVLQVVSKQTICDDRIVEQASRVEIHQMPA